jgi:endonuclease/exonuclease/phosphatase family metal-dependent hydrolase
LARVRLAVLTWNLYHGRAVPPAGRNLLPAFAATLSGWDWDLALLQEVPPWWPPELARTAGADQRLAMTSRNQLLPLRRVLATRWPDPMRSGGGGCNAILVRGVAIAEHRCLRLRRFPEGRWLHGVRLSSGIWAANLHGTAHDSARAAEEAARAGAATLSWTEGALETVLGGDFNLRRLELEGFEHAGGHDVDHVFAAGLKPIGGAQTLDRGSLSDHAPVMVRLEG